MKGGQEPALSINRYIYDLLSMSIRQQRNAQNRRVTTQTNPLASPDLAIRVAEIVANQVAFAIDNNVQPLIYDGVPPILLDGVTYPTGLVSHSDHGFTLNYPASITAPTRFVLAAGTLQVRNSFGGRLGPLGQLIDQLPFPPLPPPLIGSVNWSLNGFDLPQVIIQCDTAGNVIGTTQPAFQNLSSGEFPDSVAYSGQTITVTYPTAAQSGDNISFPDNNLTVWVDTGAALVSQTRAIP